MAVGPEDWPPSEAKRRILKDPEMDFLNVFMRKFSLNIVS
jgi:hypothetical protein